MNTNYLKWHTHQELEEIAIQIHKKYECSIPVDIDYIAEMIGLEILDVSRLKEDFGVYGLLAKVKGKYVIYIQKGAFDITNYNTTLTIAEELSHYIVHKEHFKDVNNIEEACSFYTQMSEETKSMMEFNAKYLAGAILVPIDDLKTRAIDFFEDHKETLFYCLDNDFNELIDRISPALSDFYRVPDIAVSYRLRTKINGFKDYIKKEYKKWKKK